MIEGIYIYTEIQNGKPAEYTSELVTYAESLKLEVPIRVFGLQGNTVFYEAEAAKTTAGVKVLGSGCAKCHALEEAARAALEELNMDTTIDHVTDFSQIAAYGVMTTPALVIDGKVVSYGKVLKKDEAKALIQKVRENA